MRRRFAFFLVFLFFIAHSAKAQPHSDTLRLTIQQAEETFFQKNLALIAQQYNIEISQALVLQSRYRDNPILNTDQNIYDGKFFRHNSQYGQVFIQLQQLIKTAGKRNKLVRLSQDAALSSQQQFQDVIRNLRFLLHTSLFTVNQYLQTNNLYQNEAVLLQSLSAGMDAQLQAGNISQRENIRIKSLLYTLQTEQADLQRDITDVEKDLRTLLQTGNDTTIVPVLSIAAENTPPPLSVNLLQLLDTARQNRPDIRLAQTNLLTQQHNLAYQKALAVPDVNAGVEYDQRSSYLPNYYGLSLSVPIPIINRNKGNIRAAEINIKQASNEITLVQKQVEAEVSAAWQKWITALNLQKLLTPDFTQKYNELLQNITRSFRERQVGLIEFIDFFDAYKEVRLKQFQQEANFRSAGSELNFTTGSNVITIQ